MNWWRSPAPSGYQRVIRWQLLSASVTQKTHGNLPVWWSPQNHGKDDKECSISAVPSEKKFNLSLDSAGFKPPEANAKHCLSWSCFPSSLALGSKPSSPVGSQDRIPGPLIAVMFPLACSAHLQPAAFLSPGQPVSPREKVPVHPPDLSRRASSATAHLFPKHML